LSRALNKLGGKQKGPYARINDDGYMTFIDPSYVEMDNAGIPIVHYGGSIGDRRNPVFVCMAALEYSKDTSKNQQLLNNADWLIANARLNGDFSLLEYDFPWHRYNLSSPPWRSAMAQGLALQVMARAHQITSNQRYLDAGKLLLNAFYVEVKDGGITYKSDHGWWYEEYAHEKASVSRVLNGMMYAVLGLYEFYQYTKDPNAKMLFDRGIAELKANIASYDNDGYSYYDILGKEAGEKYHKVHVIFAKRLYEITKEEIFNTYYQKWKAWKFK
jgi:hypothetical protein